MTSYDRIYNKACFLLLRNECILCLIDDIKPSMNALFCTSYTCVQRRVFIHMASAYCIEAIFAGWMKHTIYVSTSLTISSVLEVFKRWLACWMGDVRIFGLTLRCDDVASKNRRSLIAAALPLFVMKVINRTLSLWWAPLCQRPFSMRGKIRWMILGVWGGQFILHLMLEPIQQFGSVVCKLLVVLSGLIF